MLERGVGITTRAVAILERSALLSRRCELPLPESVLKRMQAILARGGERTLLAQRQRERANVRVAAGQLDDLSVDAHEPIERGIGGVELADGMRVAPRLPRVASALRTAASSVAICFSMPVIAASSASAMCGA